MNILDNNLKEDILKIITDLKIEDRLKLFSFLNEEFCFSCGYEQPYMQRCQCYNDE